MDQISTFLHSPVQIWHLVVVGIILYFSIKTKLDDILRNVNELNSDRRSKELERKEEENWDPNFYMTDADYNRSKKT